VMSFGCCPNPRAAYRVVNDLLSQILAGARCLAGGRIRDRPLFDAAQLRGHAFELNYFRLIGLLSLYACALTWIQMLELVKDKASTVEAFKPISYHSRWTRGAAAAGWGTSCIYSCSASLWTGARCRFDRVAGHVVDADL